MIVPAWVRLTLLPIGAAQALSSQIDHPPKPVSGRAITSWETEQRSAVISIGTRIIRARNDTTIPIAFTQVRLSECKDVRTSCDVHSVPPTIIAPGGTAVLLSVQPVTPGHRPRFSFAVDWRPVPECSNPQLPPADDTAAMRLAQPVETQIILPPPRYLTSAVRVEVEFFVGANGVVDSTQIAGVTDSDLRSVLTKVFAGYGFRPGLYRGCPVSGTYGLSITLGPQQ